MEAVYQILIADAATTNLVGSKIYPVTEPQKQGYPAVVYSQLNEDYIDTKDGPIENGYRFTIEIYSESYTEAQAVAKVIKDKLKWYTGDVDSFSYTIKYTDKQDLPFDPDTMTFGIVQDYGLKFKQNT